MNIKSLFFFDSMLTTKIITGVYWVSLVALVIGSIGTMVQFSFFAGLGSLIGGVIFLRVMCELMIVVFKINDNLQAIKDKQCN